MFDLKLFPDAFSEGTPLQSSLQLLLFVDDRPGSRDRIRNIKQYLQSLQADSPFDLQVVDVGNQPYLAEHFKLVATPALVKIYPEPQQTLAGSDIIAQLNTWWTRWQDGVQQEPSSVQGGQDIQTYSYSAEVLRLSDEIFHLKQEKEALLEKLHFKDQILAMLAHDLRSPLTAASIAVETLELIQNQPPTERSESLKQQLYKQAKTQFKTLNRMIDDILQTSSDSTAKLRVRPRKLNLSQLCEDLIHQYNERFESKSLILKADFPQDIPAVYADAELVHQVMVNLLENALKYTPKGGKIQTSILHRTMQKVQVTVCDTGPGIPEEKRDLIFEGRFRLQRDQDTEGYGIGLSLCRKVIQAHYGHIWVDSVPNRGSCFHFTLPVYRH